MVIGAPSRSCQRGSTFSVIVHVPRLPDAPRRQGRWRAPRADDPGSPRAGSCLAERDSASPRASAETTIVCHELTAWQAVTGCRRVSRVVYSLRRQTVENTGVCPAGHDLAELVTGFRRSCRDMPSVSRATTIRRDAIEREPDTGTVYRPADPAGKRGSKLRRAGEISLRLPGQDLSTRLRVFRRSLRGRVQRRDTLVEIMRAVNTTLDPVRLAEIVVGRAATWFPAPCWAVVSSDFSGQLMVLADRGLTPDMGPASTPSPSTS